MSEDFDVKEDEEVETSPIMSAKEMDDFEGKRLNSNEVRDLLHAQKYFEIKISSTKEDKSDVILSINGYTYQIKRDNWVKVPESILLVLENAVQTDIYKEEDENGKITERYVNVKRFPFEVKR